MLYLAYVRGCRWRGGGEGRGRREVDKRSKERGLRERERRSK